MFNYEAMFTNKNVHEKVNIFNKCFYFIPNENVIFDDNDPSWINEFVKSKTKWKM